MVALPSQLKQKEKTCPGVFLLFFSFFFFSKILCNSRQKNCTRKGTRSCTRKPKVEHEKGHQKLHEKTESRARERAPEVARENGK